MQNSLEEILDKSVVLSFKIFLVRVFQTLNPNHQFLDNWHINLIATYLENIPPGTHLIINIPPRYLKSTIVSVAWPAWLLAKDASKRIIVASYSRALSIKHSVECKLIINSKWYKNAFPNTQIRVGSNTKDKFITTQNGFRFATSIGGTLTGEGADVLIVDDPHTPLQAASLKMRNKALEWFDHTFSTRLDNKKLGIMIVIMQRLHHNDLSGHLIKKNSWQHLKFPVISSCNHMYKVNQFKYLYKLGKLLHEKRENFEDLEKIKIELGSWGFNSQYLQEPLIAEGNLIQKTWLKYIEDFPSDFDIIYHSLDCASKTGDLNDYSANTIWGIKDNDFYLIDVYRKKLTYPKLKEELLDLAKRYPAEGILIEDKSSGQSLIQDLRANTWLPIIGVTPISNKFSRLYTVLSYFEAGKINVPKSATWLAEYEHELFNFPNILHDDMLDATTQFLNWIKNKINLSIKRL